MNMREKVAIYCRLSEEDKNKQNATDDSGSIQNQKAMLREYADIAVIMPCNETYQIQELHLPVYHCLCLMLEEHFFG